MNDEQVAAFIVLFTFLMTWAIPMKFFQWYYWERKAKN